MWVRADREDTAVSCLPKNGSTAIKTCRERRDHLTHDEAQSHTYRVGILREPTSRLHSMYRYLKAQHEEGASTLRSVPTGSYEAFVDYALTNENEHWSPQVGLLGGVPNVWYRFEDIDVFWPDYFDVALPHKNASPAHAVNGYRRNDIETKYRRDIDLWQSLGD